MSRNSQLLSSIFFYTIEINMTSFASIFHGSVPYSIKYNGIQFNRVVLSMCSFSNPLTFNLTSESY